MWAQDDSERDKMMLAPQAVRREAGRSRRSEVPLEAHSELPAEGGRADPVDILVAQDQARIAELVPIRHGRMNATAFTFYRGTAAVMASDLSMTPATGLQVQLCGDAHLSNFGIFNGPDRRLIFDVGTGNFLLRDSGRCDGGPSGSNRVANDGLQFSSHASCCSTQDPRKCTAVGPTDLHLRNQ